MSQYTQVTLQHGINDVTYMDNGRIIEVKWNVPLYFLRGNTYENIGTINDIRRRGTFTNNITDANSQPIGSVDDFISGNLRGRLFIKNYEENMFGEKRTPPKLQGGKRRRKSRKSSNKKRKQRKSKRTKKIN